MIVMAEARNDVEMDAEVHEQGLVLSIESHGQVIRLCNTEIWWVFEKLHQLHNKVIGDF